MTHLLDLKEFTLEEMEQLLAAWGQPRYRARQVAKWLYKGVVDFQEMTDIARSFREELASRAHLSRLSLAGVQEAADGVRKMLLALKDGHHIEAVLIPEGGHATLCLSSQVGCAQGCAFCLTAQRGFVRNLTAAEIVNQVLAARTLLPPGLPLTNLVFMGMGEPLANFAGVARALKIITAAWGLNFSPRRITVSTVGLAPLIPRLGREVKFNLTISLNAADDDLRSRLMPVNRRYPLKTLLQACRDFPLPRHRRITFAYVLLKDVNDAPAQARQLARLLRGLRVKINLIPFNPHARLPFAPPAEKRILEFQEILREKNYAVFIRESRGQEIAAACGHLLGEPENFTAEASKP
ncbi:MAG: 23S rRNA (adenine(2503)-C(2))-methyltransferase RlmN [Thermodesulfobacteriota bacterium]